MSFKFEFDEAAFRRLVETEVRSSIEQIARDTTREFDQLRIEYAGRPVEVIKPAVQRLWAKDGGRITDPELTEYAQAISDGTKIEFVVDKSPFRL